MVAYGSFQGRIEDARLVTGRGRYVADLVLPGMAHAVLVRSPHAHADVRSIETVTARAAPGVLGVFTAADLAADGIPDLPLGVGLPRPDGSQAPEARRPVLARDRVRFVGEGVALVVAETAAAAADAAELVEVDYAERPAVTDPAAARTPGAPELWPGAPDNVGYAWQKGDRVAVEAAMAGAAHVVRLASHVSRVNANSLEPRGALGYVDDAGRLVVHVSNQHPHQLKGALAPMLGVAPEQVRVIAGDVGGSFGMKSGAYPEDVLVLFAARRLGRPVRWIAERGEGFLTDDHGRDVHVSAALALDAEGRFLALEADYVVNVGCYLSARSMGMINNIGGVVGVYRIPAVAARILGVLTNTQSTAPYRGAGRPEATYTIERLIDLAARRLGLDPFELRRRNLVPADAMPYDTGFVFKYDCGDFAGTMAAAAGRADLAGFAARREAAARRGKLAGLGLANPIEVAGGPYAKPGKDHTRLLVGADGRVTLHAGIMSTGQGHETTFSELVARRLGITAAEVDYRFGDTDDLPGGRGNGGSAGLAVGGGAVSIVTDRIIDTARQGAAEMLQATPEQVTFEAGRFIVTDGSGAPVRSVGLFEVAAHLEQTRPRGLAESAEFQPPTATFPNGTHVCEVEIDPETGSIEIVRYTVVEDVGTVLNPTLVEGQLLGGIAQGVGQALGERLVHDGQSGQLLTASFMDYAMPRADLLPPIDITTRGVPTAINPIGAKGVGEAGTVGALAATLNAVCDALAAVGVVHIEMPATPDRVWAAIAEAKGTS
jgi:carbon-monoxide dehydrogenase large subunit